LLHVKIHRKNSNYHCKQLKLKRTLHFTAAIKESKLGQMDNEQDIKHTSIALEINGTLSSDSVLKRMKK